MDNNTPTPDVRQLLYELQQLQLQQLRTNEPTDNDHIQQLNRLYNGSSSSLCRTTYKIDETYTKCEYCQSENVLLKDSVYYCNNCNSIIDQYVDNQIESINCDEKSNKNRADYYSQKQDLCEQPAGSQIDRTYRSNTLSQYQQRNINTYKNKSLNETYDEIMAICKNGHIPQMIGKDAFKYFKQISESKGIFKTEKRKGMYCACIYYACSYNQFSRNHMEIAKFAGISHKKVTEGINIFNQYNFHDQLQQTPQHYVERHAQQLNMTPFQTEEAIRILSIIEKKQLLSSRVPRSREAASLQMVLRDEHEKKKLISEVCDISPANACKIYQEIKMYEKLFYPQ